MKLFIETNSGRLQNLYLLQGIEAVHSRTQEGKFAVGYIQSNGVIIEDEIFDTLEEAMSEVENAREQLLEE